MVVCWASVLETGWEICGAGGLSLFVIGELGWLELGLIGYLFACFFGVFALHSGGWTLRGLIMLLGSLYDTLIEKFRILCIIKNRCIKNLVL